MAFTRSATVSVNAQKNGGLCAHPMGSVSGMATKGGLGFGISFGMTTARFSAVAGESGTR